MYSKDNLGLDAELNQLMENKFGGAWTSENWSLESEIWNLKSGIPNQKYGIWSRESGIWNLKSQV